MEAFQRPTGGTRIPVEAYPGHKNTLFSRGLPMAHNAHVVLHVAQIAQSALLVTHIALWRPTGDKYYSTEAYL